MMDEFKELLNGQYSPSSQNDLYELEKIENISLPQNYKNFLNSIGGCVLDLAQERRIIKFYKPEEIYDLYKDFFDDASMIFSKYIPIGYDEELQEVYVIDVKQPENKNFTRISHEYVPDDWGDVASWGDLDDWLIFLAQSKGRVIEPI